MTCTTLELEYRSGVTSIWNMGARKAADRLVDRLTRYGRIRRWRITEKTAS
ncbi:hypothetical protein PWY87_33990 [Kribbella solani]|uniref:hypothetical protein n=1 Tax=Kribbella solani TaxID=236067 RepID=UPI0029A58391|nr:hypothetical protein [Kribbella solani]MDX3006728.1 hypothetical protein [Kribbella solani]